MPADLQAGWYVNLGDVGVYGSDPRTGSPSSGPLGLLGRARNVRSSSGYNLWLVAGACCDRAVETDGVAPGTGVYLPGVLEWTPQFTVTDIGFRLGNELRCVTNAS